MFGLFPASLRSAALALPCAAMMAGAALPARAQTGTFGTDQHYCDRSALSQILSTSQGNLLGSAAGAALGGLLGNQLGKGTGNALATLAGVVGGALAGGYIGRSMDPTDQACVGQTLEHTATNQTVAWRDPSNGASYWVTPTNTYQGPNGDPCRTYITQAVFNGEPQRTESAACRDQRGTWTPVSLTPQGAAAAPPRPAESARPTYAGSLSSDTVLKVQQRLHDLGFYVRDNIDGQWGPHTAKALTNFQSAKGLTPSGQLDLQTLAALGLSGQQAASPNAPGAPPAE